MTETSSIFDSVQRNYAVLMTNTVSAPLMMMTRAAESRLNAVNGATDSVTAFVNSLFAAQRDTMLLMTQIMTGSLETLSNLTHAVVTQNASTTIAEQKTTKPAGVRHRDNSGVNGDVPMGEDTLQVRRFQVSDDEKQPSRDERASH